MASINWFHYAAPQRFYPLAGRLVPWFGALAVVLTAQGKIFSAGADIRERPNLGATPGAYGRHNRRVRETHNAIAECSKPVIAAVNGAARGAGLEHVQHLGAAHDCFERLGAELTRLAPARIVILGGPGAVSAGVEAALDGYTTGPVQRLAGASVRIPGFVVPLETDGEQIREFLLVPYFGACVHVPPPPANQLIHVIPDQPVPAGWNMLPVWVEGVMAVGRVDSEMGVAGYQLRGIKVEEYQEPLPK